MTTKTYTPGYYQLFNKEIIRVTYDGGRDTQIYCEKENGESIKLRRKTLDAAQPIDYKPNHAELWELSKTIPKKSFDKKEIKGCGEDFEFRFNQMRRVEFFFLKLIEFELIKINTLGYYGTDPKWIKENLGRHIAYKMGESFHILTDEKIQRAKAYEDSHLKWDAWIKNPNFETAGEFFANERALSVDRECPYCGDRFQWGFDGDTVFPVTRIRTSRETKATNAELKKELTALKKKASRSPEEEKRFTLLSDVFTDYGWMRHYDLLHLEPVKPFSEVYADPATGKYPKVVVRITIPSGQLVFANSLYNYVKDFPKDEEHAPENSVCHLRGRRNTSLFHAKENNTIFVQVGNTSPHVFQSKKDPSSLRIGRPVEEDPTEEQWSYTSAKRNWKDKGYICTDLWAFMATDRTNLPEKIEVDHFIVEVPPGTYELINHYEDEGYDSGIYAEIHRVDTKN